MTKPVVKSHAKTLRNKKENEDSMLPALVEEPVSFFW